MSARPLPAAWEEVLRRVARFGGIDGPGRGEKRLWKTLAALGYLRREHGVFYTTARAAVELAEVDAWRSEVDS